MFNIETPEDAAERKRQDDAAYIASMVAGAARAIATEDGYEVYRAYAGVMADTLQGKILDAGLVQLWKAVGGYGEPEKLDAR